MPIPIRKSDRAAQKRLRESDITLDNDLTFLFYFSSDNSYMLFGANEDAWPKSMLNSEKISLQRGELVNFGPKLGNGKYQTSGPSAAILLLGEYMSDKLEATDCDVDALDITQVLRGIVEKLKNSDDGPAPLSQASGNDEDFSYESVAESDGSSPELGPPQRKVMKKNAVTANKEMSVENRPDVAGTSKNSSKCPSCGHSVGELAAKKDLVCEKLLHVISRLEQRMVKSEGVQKDIVSVSRKAMKEIDGLKDAAREKENVENVEPESHVYYNNVCLTDLGGETAEEKGKRIAKKLWSKEELAKIVIDPKKELNSAARGRVRADVEREECFKTALKAALGDQYTKKLYRRTVRLVNVMGNGYKNKGFKDDSD